MNMEKKDGHKREKDEERVGEVSTTVKKFATLTFMIGSIAV